MKKMFVVLLVLIMVISMAQIMVFADSGELLQNPSFQNGVEKWTTSGTGTTLAASSESQDDDGSGMLVKNRTVLHASMAVNTASAVQQYGNGDYVGSMWVKLAETNAASIKLSMAFQLTWMEGDTKKQSWLLSTAQEVTGNGWVNLKETITIKDAAATTEVKFYFYQDASSSTFPDVLADNCSFKKLGNVVTPAPTLQGATKAPQDTATRPGTTRIGAIRWDAFYATTGNATNVSDQVAKALSPVKYHKAAPYFSKVNSDGTISFPEYTLSTWEEEADYAIDAGIDYFAYLWYSSNDPMSIARKYHVQSAKHDKIQMCGIIESIGFDAKTYSELFEAMKQDYYLKINGMPILYFYDATKGADADKVKELRNKAATAGVSQPLYLVAMATGNSVPESAAKQFSEMGFSAVSFYSTSATEENMKYKALATVCENRNRSLEGYKKYIAAIPSITFGRDTEPRLDNPVSWAGDYAGKYAVAATPDEIKQHVTNVLNWTNDNKDLTAPNCVLSYAWNEHDEGGWICPALKVDAQGNILKDASGKAQRNTEYLDAVKAAIKDYRTIEKNTAVATTATPVISQAPGETIIPTSTEGNTGDDNKKGGFNILYVIIPIVAAGIGGGSYVMLKRKNKKGEE